MKDKRMIDSWDKIVPDEDAQKRMLENVLLSSEQSVKKKKTKLNWKFAAVITATTVAIAVCAILIVPALPKNQSSTHMAANTPESTANTVPNIGDTVPDATYPQDGDTVLERIMARQEFGVVSRSKRSPEEVDSLALRAGISVDRASEVICYEDDMYTYIFYDDGTPAGIYASYWDDVAFDPASVWDVRKLSEEEALALADTALKKYCESYSDATKDRFQTEVWNADADGINHYTEWRLTFTEYTPSGIRRNVLAVEIDVYGNVAAVMFGIRGDAADEELNAIDTIDQETAISLAVAQLEEEGNAIEMADFNVEAELFDFEDTLWWSVTFEKKPDATDAFPRGFFVTLNAETGDVWHSSQSR